MTDLQLQQTREEAKTFTGAESQQGFMEAARLFFDYPLSDLGSALGLSKSTIQRIRRRIRGKLGGPQGVFMNTLKTTKMNTPSAMEEGNSDFPPSSSYFPPPPKGGVPPRGNQKSGPGGSKKQSSKTPCPADWQPRDEDRQYAVGLGLDPDRLRDTMVDWSREDPMRNRKASWDATYRNWARREGERRATEKARLEGQRQNYLQARQGASETPLDRQATERAKAATERRRAALAIAQRYNGGEP